MFEEVLVLGFRKFDFVGADGNSVSGANLYVAGLNENNEFDNGYIPSKYFVNQSDLALISRFQFPALAKLYFKVNMNTKKIGYSHLDNVRPFKLNAGDLNAGN